MPQPPLPDWVSGSGPEALRGTPAAVRASQLNPPVPSERDHGDRQMTTAELGAPDQDLLPPRPGTVLRPSWSLGDYELLLGKLGVTARSFLSFDAYRGGQDGIWLRHDVELHVGSALRMAALEHAVGIQASYFVCWTSPALRETPVSVREDFALQLQQFGHAVGLHVWRRRPARVPRWCTIDAMTFHEPRLAPEDLVGRAKGFDVYQPVVERRVEYVSDSTGQWRWGRPEEQWSGVQSLQLLTHPYWWSDDAGHRCVDVTPDLMRFLPQVATGR
jgi:hypothetical protein